MVIVCSYIKPKKFNLRKRVIEHEYNKANNDKKI